MQAKDRKETLIAALKLAETAYLKPAILLIDDFGVHLDQNRKARFEEKILIRISTFFNIAICVRRF
jgi:Recombinational DNA repair ATPase (RecF pathway)